MGWAWVDHEGGRFDSGGAATGTNQIAELTAVLRAIEAHPGDQPLLIESDSKYAISCATDWIEGWRRKGWRTASGSPVKNLELVQAIDRAIAERPGSVRFRWVRGHVGNPFNERADALAVMAAKEWQAGRGEITDTLLDIDAAIPATADGAHGLAVTRGITADITLAEQRLTEALATLQQAQVAVEQAKQDLERAQAKQRAKAATTTVATKPETPAPPWEPGALFD